MLAATARLFLSHTIRGWPVPVKENLGKTALGVSLGFRESMAAASFGGVHRQEPSSTNWPLEIMEARERAQVRILWCMGSSLRESGGVYSTASCFSRYLPARSSLLLNSLVNNSKALRSASVVASTDARRKPSTAWLRWRESQSSLIGQERSM